MPYANCAKCGKESHYTARRGDRIRDQICHRVVGGDLDTAGVKCGGSLRGKGGRLGPRSMTQCAVCKRRREIRNTQTFEVVTRCDSVTIGVSVEVPAGAPICKYFHRPRVHVACCDRWAASHLTVPCGSVAVYLERARERKECPQCYHSELCCVTGAGAWPERASLLDGDIREEGARAEELLAAANAEARRTQHPHGPTSGGLPRCAHGSALMDWGSERLEPPCGCRFREGGAPMTDTWPDLIAQALFGDAYDKELAMRRAELRLAASRAMFCQRASCSRILDCETNCVMVEFEYGAGFTGAGLHAYCSRCGDALVKAWVAGCTLGPTVTRVIVTDARQVEAGHPLPTSYDLTAGCAGQLPLFAEIA